MTDLEYMTAIESLVISGRGFQAISDISKALENLSSNYESAVHEFRCEKKLILKICDNPNTTNRTKVNDIRSILT